VATCTVTLGPAATLTTVTAKFAGDKAYTPQAQDTSMQIWSPSAAVSAPPSAGSSTAPAVVWLGSSWFAAWRDASSGDIYWTLDSGKGWQKPIALVADGTTITTAHAPSVASDGGLPVIAWTSASGSIEYSGFALVAWSDPRTVSGSWGTARTGHGPQFAETAGHGLIAAWTGASSKHVFYALFSDGTWQPQQDLASTTTDYAPTVAAATTGSAVLAYLSWTNGNGTIGRELLSGSTATSLGDIPDAKSDNGPASTVTPNGSTVVEAWKGASSDHVYYRYYHAIHGGVYEQQRDEPQALTTQAPALAIDAPDLRLLWTAASADVVEEAQTAGS
jgi:hypothetical protein